MSGTCTEPQSNALASPVVSSLMVPHGTAGGTLLPVADVRGYLRVRQPVPHYEQERHLFDRLPVLIRDEVRMLFAAVQFVRRLVGCKVKVQPACLLALQIYPQFNPLKTFRPKYDLYARRQDWFVLVNKAKAGGLFQESRRGLDDRFLDYVAARMGEFRRGDAAEQAILSIYRQWQSGLNHRNEAEIIPGYESGWDARCRALVPEGWSSCNIRVQLKKRAKFTKAVKAILHEGNAAARKHVPQVHGTRSGNVPLRFMELVQFDDVRCDFRVMDTDSGQVNDLWLLIARDVATGMLLGFGMRPARARDDGSQEHLKLQDMKQLCGWLLETYGLPPYQMTWVLENGTATLNESVRAALAEMVGADRIDFQMASMIGGKSALGYWEKAVGNSKAKAMLESLNRLQHLMTSHFPGQIGLNYSKLPAEYRQREREAIAIWESHRPEDRADLRYPFYTIPQARAGLFEIFGLQNQRTDHRMEGFAEIAEWFDAGTASWQSSATAPENMEGIKTRTRMESPVERAARLLAGSQPFTKVSPEILTAFYEHTQRSVTVSDKGEVQVMVEGKVLRFTPPAPEFALAPETKCLGYFNPDDPRFLILTDGRGGILGTWLRRGLVKHGDHEALAAAIRHSTAALNVAKDRAANLAAGNREELQAMRDHNSGFVTVYADKSEIGNRKSEISSPVAGTIGALTEETKATRRDAARRAKELERFEGSVDDLVSPAAEAQPETKDDFSPEGLL